MVIKHLDIHGEVSGTEQCWGTTGGVFIANGSLDWLFQYINRCMGDVEVNFRMLMAHFIYTTAHTVLA